MPNTIPAIGRSPEVQDETLIMKCATARTATEGNNTRRSIPSRFAPSHA